jgi:hypothetical protein
MIPPRPEKKSTVPPRPMSKKVVQQNLFDIQAEWEKQWVGMPEFSSQDKRPYSSVTVHFENLENRRAFSKLVDQNVTELTKSIWYPKSVRNSGKAYRSAVDIQPRYPVYVISKGRWESRLTSKAFEEMGVPYRIVIEPQEFDQYAAVINPEKILTLPFSNLGQGSIPARNWCWEHSISEGAERHWIVDDNINGFVRFNNNKKIPTKSGAIFRAMEDFTDRYTNVALSGPNYRFFCESRAIRPAYTPNTRVYSCILIRNDLTHRWRGRYNEDTDLSIRALKDGWCTILFNVFLANKAATMTMKGGNTDELYQEDGRYKMAKSLKDQHPDVVRIARKWGRWQHHVDYRPFRNNKFILKEGVTIGDAVNNYGLKLGDV